LSLKIQLKDKTKLQDLEKYYEMSLFCSLIFTNPLGHYKKLCDYNQIDKYFLTNPRVINGRIVRVNFFFKVRS